MATTFSINQVQLLGKLGADPEVKYTHSGQPVCKLKLATDRRVKKGEQYETETEWHQVTLWGKDAEAAAQQLHKGSRFHVASGRLQTRSWDDKDGNKRYSTEIVAELVTFPDGWKKDAGAAAPSRHETSKANGYAPQPEVDIPF